MSTVSKIPPAKHGQMIKNPGYSGKTKPIIKIKAIKITKKGGKKRSKTQQHTRSNRKTHKKSHKTKRTKRGKTTKRRKRKAGSHSMIGRMTKPMKRAMGYYSKQPQHDYSNEDNIDISYYRKTNFQPPQPIINKDPVDEPSTN